jgi:hypothetical protein
MSLVDIFLAQLTEPFRVGLLIMLVVTAVRTAHSVGTIVPIALGLVFVAVMIPFSLGPEGAPKSAQIGVGLVSNAVILLVILAGKALYTRYMASR